MSSNVGQLGNSTILRIDNYFASDDDFKAYQEEEFLEEFAYYHSIEITEEMTEEFELIKQDGDINIYDYQNQLAKIVGYLNHYFDKELFDWQNFSGVLVKYSKMLVDINLYNYQDYSKEIAMYCPQYIMADKFNWSDNLKDVWLYAPEFLNLEIENEVINKEFAKTLSVNCSKFFFDKKAFEYMLVNSYFYTIGLEENRYFTYSKSGNIVEVGKTEKTNYDEIRNIINNCLMICGR